VYTAQDPTEGTNRSERAYDELKRRLLVGDFPLNVRLAEERLAAALGVSRTPVRAALARLGVEGLVERVPDGGYQPAVPDVGAVAHLYEVRVALELQALRRRGLHGGRHDLGALVALRAEWGQLAGEAYEPDPGFVLLDESFHLGLAEAGGNPVLVEVLRQLSDRIRLVRMQDFLTPGRIEETIAEHLAILDALLDGDDVGAQARLVTHIDGSQAVVAERVHRAIVRMASGGTRPDEPASGGTRPDELASGGGAS
jgi:DNA-binding GntR family transcriptional regulator